MEIRHDGLDFHFTRHRELEYEGKFSRKSNY
jgi:hypothetical protein